MQGHAFKVLDQTYMVKHKNKVQQKNKTDKCTLISRTYSYTMAKS